MKKSDLKALTERVMILLDNTDLTMCESIQRLETIMHKKLDMRQKLDIMDEIEKKITEEFGASGFYNTKFFSSI